MIVNLTGDRAAAFFACCFDPVSMAVATGLSAGAGLYASNRASRSAKRGLRAQAAEIADREGRAAAAEEGQRRARSGGRGLLAYVDDDDLYQKLGGG